MRNIRSRLLLPLALLAALLLNVRAPAASAADAAGAAGATDAPIRILVNGQEIHPDTAAQIVDGRVLVPARFIAEPLGAKVSWDGTARAVLITYGDGLTPAQRSPDLAAAAPTAQPAAAAQSAAAAQLAGSQGGGQDVRLFINGQEIRPDVPPRIVDGRVMVPARFVAEPLGASVRWSAAERTVVINDRLSGRLAADAAGLCPFQPTDIFFFEVSDWGNLDVVKRTHATNLGSTHQTFDHNKVSLVEGGAALYATSARQAGFQTLIIPITSDSADSKTAGTPDDWVYDIDGNPVVPLMDANGRHWMSLLSPTWQRHITDLAKAAVDSGVDVLTIDTWSLNFDVANGRTNGDFSKYSMAGFRDYLQGRYAAAELAAAGIADINAFDYAAFIRDGYRQAYLTGDRRRDVPFYQDFLDFQLEASRKFWSDLMTEVRAYAAAQGHKVYFSDNAAGDLTTNLALAEDLDGFISEFDFGEPPASRTVAAHKLVRSLGKYSGLQTNCADAALYARPDVAELMKLYTAEAYASGGFTYVPYADMLTGTARWNLHYAALDGLYSYYDFIAGSPFVYDGLTSTARVGLMFNYAAEKGQWFTSSSFYGMANLLQDAHTQYDVVVAGDGRWLPDRLTLAELNRYDVVILPNVRTLTERQNGLLLDYLRQGGTTVTAGDTPAALVEGGAAAPGLGQITVLSDDIGAAYAGSRDAGAGAQTQARARVAEALRGLVSEDVQTSAPPEVTALAYAKADGSQILHLLNYDFDLAAGRFRAQTGLEFTVRLDPRMLGRDIGVYYRSPDGGGTQELPFTANVNSISFRVPRLDVYGVVAIGPKGWAPAEWQVGALRLGAPGAPELKEAEALLAQGDYGAAEHTAVQAVAAMTGTKAGAALDSARDSVTWWERAGRTYRLAEAKQLVAQAADRYAAGEYQGAIDGAEEALALLRPAVDGDLADWTGIAGLPLTFTAQAGAGKPHIASIKAMNDGDWLYLAVELTDTGGEPNLDVAFAVSGGSAAASGGSAAVNANLYANRWGAGMAANGTKISVTSAVRDGTVEIRMPVDWIGEGRNLEISVFASSGAAELPFSSRVQGDRVKSDYVIEFSRD